MYVKINLENKNVVIIGAGKVALRKAKLCLQEKAKVRVIAKSFMDEFYDLPISCIQKAYEANDLDHCIMVIAATNDPSLQRQIISDAAQKQIFSMGVHMDIKGSMQAMCGVESEYFDVAVSTNAHFPSLAKPLANELSKHLNTQEKDRIEILARLRKLFIKEAKKDMRHTLACLFAQMDTHVLKSLEDVLHHNEISIICYHGVKREEALEEVYEFESEIQKKHTARAVISVYMADAVCKLINREHIHILTLQDLMLILKAFPQKELYLQPMLFQEGRYYNMIKKYEDEHIHICSIPFQMRDDVKGLFDEIKRHAPTYDTLILRYHSSRNGRFATYIQELSPLYNDMVFSFEKEESDAIQVKGKDICIVPLYMLKGNHMQDDLYGEHALTAYFMSLDKNVTCIEESAIVNPFLKQYLLSKIV